MKGLIQFLASIGLVFITAMLWESFGGWIIMGLVIALPLLDYLMQSDKNT